MRSLLRTAGLYFHTIRYLRPEQVLWRVWLRGRGPLDRLNGRRLHAAAAEMAADLQTGHLLPDLNSLQGGLSEVQKEALLAGAKDIAALRFTFLQETREFPKTVDWHPADTSLLWRYHLHYFDYALTLALAAQVVDTGERHHFYEVFRHLAGDWVARNPLGRGDGWRPYPLSLRIVNWLYAFRAFQSELARDSAFRKRLAESIALQALYLQRHLEFDVGGNHLIKNAKALFLAGLFGHGPGADRMLAVGERILLHQLPMQVLPDGGHYERSAHYHKIVLVDYLECWAAASVAGRPWPEEAGERLRAMTGFLAGCLHPDGDIPLFGDAGLEPPQPAEVVAAARALIGEPDLPDGSIDGPDVAPEGFSPWVVAMVGKRITVAPRAIRVPVTVSQLNPVAAWAFPETGWFFLRSETGHVAVDAGPPCPPDLPAHAHSDGLSVEVSWGGHRLIVDPGAYLYQDQPWRDFLRSTAAHNTVSVQGFEQTETWGQFRAARRAQPLGARSWAGDGWVGFQGSLRYGTNSQIVHRRWIALWSTGLLIIDALSCLPAPAHARLLLAPGYATIPVSPNSLRLDGPAGRFTAVASSSLHTLAPSQGPGHAWYSPKYGVIEPTVTLDWGSQTTPVLAFSLLQGEIPVTSLTVKQQPDRIEIRLGADGLDVTAVCATEGLDLTVLPSRR